MADNSRPIRLQFSLRTMLWMMLCAAIGLGTYWQGFRAGRNCKEPPEPSFGYANVYYVEDLLDSDLYQSTGQGFEDLRQRITANVLPSSWLENGGKANIRVFASNSSLVIVHEESGHEQVAAYLEDLRHNSAESETNPR